MRRFILQNGLKRLAWALVVVILLALPAERTAGATRIAVADQVQRDVNTNGWADILVLLRAQADSQAAASGTNMRMAKSRAVFEALRSTALSSQPALAQVFNSRGIKYQPFWIVNAIAVRASAALVQELAARSDVAAIVSNAPFHMPLEE